MQLVIFQNIAVLLAHISYGNDTWAQNSLGTQNDFCVSARYLKKLITGKLTCLLSFIHQIGPNGLYINTVPCG